MSTGTSIEWTDATWNPVRGCTKVSPGCKHCYAETFAERWRGVAGHPYEQGFDLRLVPEKLDEPLRWRKPRRVFVNSMSDLFQDGVPDDFLVAVFGTMLASMQHTYQVLTKRPERMLAWHRWLSDQGGLCAYIRSNPDRLRGYFKSGSRFTTYRGKKVRSTEDAFCMVFNAAACWGTPPLPNVWLGVSTENQETADERIPLLLQTPAAVRFVSAEPLLGPIDFTHLDADAAGSREFCQINALTGRQTDMGRPCADLPSRLDWIIVGGESGPGARGCHVSWIRSIVNQCREAKVACFVKQLGAKPLNWCRAILDGDYPPGDLEPDHCDLYEASESGRCSGRCVFLNNRKGADPSDWPEDLRVQEFPR